MRPFSGLALEIRTGSLPGVLCTPDHPFITQDGVKLAAQLTVMDSLPMVAGGPVADGQPTVVVATTTWVRIAEVVSRPFAGPVYSLEVPGSHTFVTTGGLVTHNCFPKDVKALAALAERFDYHPELLHAVMDINRDQRMLVIDKLREVLDGLNNKVVGLLGLAFKPNTDDLREAPSLDIARVLLAAGAHVRAYDPAAMERTQAMLPDIEYCKDAYEVAAGADAIILVTEWNEFRQLDLARVKSSMRKPVVIDGRNIYVPATMRELGFTYRGVGRE
jgi:UDP-N-acetyl-D-mannosaminuronate dehydrogenase